MHDGHCPRCGAVMASAEYLGEIAEQIAARPGTAARLLDAVRTASAEDVEGLMARMGHEAPGLAAALSCYVGTCSPVRSEARAR